MNHDTFTTNLTPRRGPPRKAWKPRGSLRIAALTLFATGAFVASTSSVEAKALKPYQEEAKSKFDDALEKPLKAMNETCGTSITLKSDFENFDREAWGRKSPHSSCVDAVKQMQNMCKTSAAYKSAIAKRIKSVACLFSGVKPQKKGESRNDFTLRNMSLEGDTFIFRTDINSVNISYVTKDALEKALNE